MVVHPATQAPAAMSIGGRSAIRGVADRIQLAREYLLTQFHKSRIVYRDEINAVVQLELEPLEELLTELATLKKDSAEDRSCIRWEFRWAASGSGSCRPRRILQRHFPKLVSQSDQALPHIENELRRLLASTAVHPAREDATRGLGAAAFAEHSA